MTDNAIEITGLHKTYAATSRAPAHEALKGIDLNIPRGMVFGLSGAERGGQIDADQHSGGAGGEIGRISENLGL